MSISILPSNLVKQDILAHLSIKDVLSFLEANPRNLKYFHIEDKMKEVFDYIFRNDGTSWNYRDNLQIIVRQFIKYFPNVFDYFIKNNINIVIWANHLLRSSVSAIKNTLKIIKKEKSLVKTENKIIKVTKLFKETNADKETLKLVEDYTNLALKSINSLSIPVENKQVFIDFSNSLLERKL